MNQFGEQPKEVQEFYLACRGALTGSSPEAALIGICRRYGRKKLGGPMLGDLSSTGVTVWVHLAEPGGVEVRIRSGKDGSLRFYKVESEKRLMFVRCGKLEPNADYSYEVFNSDQQALGGGRFRTPPMELSNVPFRLAFGADFHKVGVYRPELMRLVRERACRAMLLIGDSAVDGRKNNLGLIRSDYLLRDLSPPWQELVANVPVSAIWDDHDYWGNDCSGNRTEDGKVIEVDALRGEWQAFWNNPERDLEREGIYFQTRIGPVHYFALDTRSCRVSGSRGARNSFLGEEQMAWLKRHLEESDARCILISGGTMWSDYISGGKDSWGTWDREGREEVFRVIDGKKDALVLLLSGDRHGARGFAIPRAHGRKIYELEVGALGGVPGPEAFARDQSDQIFGFPGKTWAFGELEITQVGERPKAVFRLIGVDGKTMESVQLDV
ncbi:MAG: alkaline phosphatase D family protein [Verrucomicrobiales bacterium]